MKTHLHKATDALQNLMQFLISAEVDDYTRVYSVTVAVPANILHLYIRAYDVQ